MHNKMLIDAKELNEIKPKYRFWYWQLGFWFFMCIVGFFTLILWYSDISAATIGHVCMQAIIGLMCSIMLHHAFNFLGDINFYYRVSIGFILIITTACLWTLLHMQVFVLLTGFIEVWDDFGGWYFSGIFIFLCWAALFLGVRYYELMQAKHQFLLIAEANSKKEHVKRIKAQSEARDAKLKMLRYQLNPHFLCNSLNAINSLIEIGEAQKAQTMTVQLSDFLRYSLENDPDNKICLLEEIDASSLYLEIEKTRFGSRLQINIDIAPMAEKALVPSLLLQPIIENSMKHAIARSEKGGIISIKAEVHDENLVLSLKDSGQNNCAAQISNCTLLNRESNDKKPLSKGVGLQNTNQRLTALYDNAYSLDAFFVPQGGLTTIIKIPLQFEIKD